MTRIKRIFKDYDEAGALNAVVNLHSAVDDRTFLTKSGDLVMFLSVGGVDADGLDPSDTDQVSRRFETVLLGTFDERFRVLQYRLKRNHTPLPFSHSANPVLEQLITNRMDHLQRKNTRLWSLETYFVVIYEPPASKPGGLEQLGRFVASPKDTLGRMLSSRKAADKLSCEIDHAREMLASKVNGFAAQLKDCLDIEILDAQRAYGILRRLLNYEPHKTDGFRLNNSSFVDFQACDSSLECHRDHLRLDDFYVQALTLKIPPARSFANMLSALTDLRSNYIIATEWKSERADDVRRIIQSKRRHFHNKKSSLLNYAAGSQTAPADMLVDDSAVALVRNLGACLEEIEVHGQSFGQFSMTVVLYDKDWMALRQSVAECYKAFAAFDGHLIEERYNLLNAWLSVLPGNSAHNLRRIWITGRNYADLSFLFSSQIGQIRNEQMGTEYLSVLEGTVGTPYFFNLHYKDVAHTLVLGSTGSGKSFLLNFVITSFQKYEPFTFIFDLGGSYETLTQLFGGAYLRVAGATRSFTINPFCLPSTPENLHFLFSFVKVLIESGGYQMSSTDDQDLYEQITSLYEIDPSQRRLLTLANILNRTLRAQLQKWVEGGPYASLFDNTKDSLTFSKFQTFDFEGMDQIPEQLEPLLFYVLHRASAVINDSQCAAVFKAFFVDEAWRFCRHPAIRAYIVEGLKTWRKRNAAMILATQSSEDLANSDILPIVAESCPTKIFLANPGMDRETYRRLFHLRETEVDLIASLAPKREFLLKQPDVTKRLVLDVDDKCYWIYTNNPQDNQRRREAFEHHGFDAGLEILAGRKG